MSEPRRHTISITARPADIDELGHVSNLVYVRWVQEVAQAHSAAVGWDSPQYRDAGAVFVVRRHEIDYVLPVFAGEELQATTWIEWTKAVSSERRTEIARNGQVVARAATLWAFVDLATGKPRKIPDAIRGAFGMAAVAVFLAACGGSDPRPPNAPKHGDGDEIATPVVEEEPRGADPAPASGNDMLDAHNALRAKHCAPPLTWSDEIAAVAQRWADHCVFEHSNSTYGENLAMGSSGYMPAEDVAAMWYAEVERYDFDAGAFGYDTGHFTQLVWKGTQRLGCGVATCGDQDLWVCNYDPPGNWEGAFRENVLPTGSC